MDKCATRLFGWWICQLDFLNRSVGAYNSGQLSGGVASSAERVTHFAGTAIYGKDDDEEAMAPLYRVDGSGVALIEINDQLTKGATSFGGTSNIRVRQAMRMAAADSRVKGVMLMIDSPGGTVAGQKPMADEIMRTAKIKPVHAHAEDSMHSAALWAGVSASYVTASPLTEIGSIGVVATVADYSEQFEKQGVKVHTISTGDYKGAFTPGTEVTDDMIAQVQSRVDELNKFFVGAVASGRKMRREKVERLATGEDWLASDAKDLGLIDAVMSDDAAIENLRKEIRKTAADRRRAENARRSRIAGA